MNLKHLPLHIGWTIAIALTHYINYHSTNDIYYLNCYADCKHYLESEGYAHILTHIKNDPEIKRLTLNK